MSKTGATATRKRPTIPMTSTMRAMDAIIDTPVPVAGTALPTSPEPVEASDVTESRGAAFTIRHGAGMSRAVYAATSLLLGAIFLLIAFVVVIFSCADVIPLMAQYLARTSHLTLSSNLDAAVAMWFVPLLFATLIYAVGVIWVLRRLASFVSRIRHSVRESLAFDSL